MQKQGLIRREERKPRREDSPRKVRHQHGGHLAALCGGGWSVTHVSASGDCEFPVGHPIYRLGGAGGIVPLQHGNQFVVWPSRWAHDFRIACWDLVVGDWCYNIVDDAMGRSSSGLAWTIKNYVETYGLGPLAAAGILLSFFLLLRRLPQDLVSDRPRAPILVRRAPATTADLARPLELFPLKGPYLPTKSPRVFAEQKKRPIEPN